MGILTDVSGAVGGLLGTGLGLLTKKWSDKQQLKQQQKLTDQQVTAEKNLGKFNQGLAMETWEKTNYSAQREQMEKAGLNVGMMYGGVGSGGTTSGGQAGNVSGGQASTNNDIAQNAALGMALGMQKAQIDNLNANTEKQKVEAAKAAGAETEEIKARIPSYQKGIEKADQEIKALATKMGVDEQQVKNMLQDIEKNKAETSKLKILTPLEAQKTNKEIELKTQEIIQSKIENKYKNTKEAEELRKMTAEIAKIQTDKNYTEEKTRNEAIINTIEKNIKNKTLTEGEGNGIIESILKLIKF